MAALVEFRNVRYQAGGREILRGADLTVEENETVVLLGRSGSGKTTLLKMVNGLIAPSSGEVRVGGTPVNAQDPIQMRRRIGYVIQDGGLFPHWTVAENTGLVPALERWPREKTEARVTELQDAVGLAPAAGAARGRGRRGGGGGRRGGGARARAAGPPGRGRGEPGAARGPGARGG